MSPIQVCDHSSIFAILATRSKDRPAADGHLMLTILVAELSIMTSRALRGRSQTCYPLESRIREFQPGPVTSPLSETRTDLNSE